MHSDNDNEPPDLPLASRATDQPARGLSRSAKVWLIVLVVLAAISLLVQVRLLSSSFSYRLGLTNSGGPGDGTLGAVPLMFAWVLLAVGQYVAMVVFVTRRPKPHVALRLAAVAIAAATTLSCVVGQVVRPRGTYEDGFAVWVRTHIDDNAIRAWAANQPAVTAPAVIPVSGQPVSISAHRPDAVEQQPGQGIVLQWGVVASWGTSRKVFIAPDTQTAPPKDDFHPWVLVRPGLWMGVQIMN